MNFEMKYFLKTLIFTILFHNLKAITESQTTLSSLQVVFNHGLRSPLTKYPNNPNDIWSRYSTSTGQLTEVGMKQMFDFGQYLRQRYPTLNSVYDRTRAWAYANDYDRTIQSAQLVMNGFYPPTSNTVWYPNSNLSGSYPYPVHTSPSLYDTIFQRHVPCPRFTELQAESRIQNIATENQNKELLSQMIKDSNMNLTYYDLWKLADKAIIDSAYNFTVDNYIKNNLEALNCIRENNYYVTYLNSIDQAKLISSGLLNQLLTYFYRKINGQTQNELYLYSGFDYYISALQKLIGTTNTITQPNFGAAMAFELRKDSNNSYYVQTLYKNNRLNEPNSFIPLTISGCETLCPVDKFKSLVSDKLLANFEESCKSTQVTVTTAKNIIFSSNQVLQVITFSKVLNKSNSVYSIDALSLFLFTIITNLFKLI